MSNGPTCPSWLLEIPIQLRQLTLEFTRPTKFHFHHGGALSGLCRAALDSHELPLGLVPLCLEQGRVTFSRGDRYQLGLTLAGPACASAEQLVRGVGSVGLASAHEAEARPTLAGNFRVIETRSPDCPSLQSMVDQLQGRRQAHLHFVSPFRQQRPRSLVKPGRGHLDESCFPAPHFLEALFRRLFRLRHARWPTDSEHRRLCPPLFPEPQAQPGELLWLDVPIRGRKARRDTADWRPGGFTIGGLLGHVTLDQLAKEWLPLLVLGSLVHVGEYEHFGFGRYSIGQSADAAGFDQPDDTLVRAAAHSNLRLACQHILDSRRREQPEDEVDAPSRCDDVWIASLSSELAAGVSNAPTLVGYVLKKPNGGLRALAVPPFRERVAQRAITQVLAPAIDTLFEDSSYAYRKGYSRGGAARAIQRAYDEGYRWVLDTDITAFFDTVDWRRLMAKVEALYPNDRITKYISGRIQAPVAFRGRLVTRVRGLPQGMPLSPLLANLYLDEFDEAMASRNYRIVRYADDFIVLCKDLDEARRAKVDVVQALAALGLDLNDAKTEFRSLDDSVRYLGYLFCRSVTLDAAPETQPAPSTMLPAHSWLAQVPLDDVRAAAELRPSDAGARRATLAPLFPPSGASLGKATPFVGSSDVRLYRQKASLVLDEPGKTPRRLPLVGISHLTLCGTTRATVSLLWELAAHGVPTYLCDRSGRLEATCAGHQPDWPVWSAQDRAALDPSVRRLFSRAVIAAKIRRQAATLSRTFRVVQGTASDELRVWAKDTDSADELDALRGLEGRAAARYFGVVKSVVPAFWMFERRQAHPPTDPVNSLMSFCYQLLHNHVATALMAAGLNPRRGILHESRGAHLALASDLVEEFRQIADRMVWDMVLNNHCTPDEFHMDEHGIGRICLMKPALRGRVVRELTARLETTVHVGSNSLSYREAMDRQAQRLRAFITGNRAEYVAFEGGT